MIKSPLILDIKGNSLDDGPGIRSVVFFKGCPLSCSWCHNPESKKASAEISFDSSECIHCNTCIETCPNKALSKENPFFIDRSKCNLCFECAENCPSGALEQVGKQMGSSWIVDEVILDKPFFDTSGGGVTFSGGEPTLQMEFLAETAKAMKNKGVHILLETCGQFNYDSFMDLVYPHIDLIYYDIKIMDSTEHKRHCGLPNETILDNFIKLHRKYQDGGTEVIPRTPLIPDITATEENLSAIASFYRKEKVNKTQLMPYHPLWIDKNRKIGITPAPDPTKESIMGKWLPGDILKSCKDIFASSGILIE